MGDSLQSAYVALRYFFQRILREAPLNQAQVDTAGNKSVLPLSSYAKFIESQG